MQRPSNEELSMPLLKTSLRRNQNGCIKIEKFHVPDHRHQGTGAVRNCFSSKTSMLSEIFITFASSMSCDLSTLIFYTNLFALASVLLAA